MDEASTSSTFKSEEASRHLRAFVRAVDPAMLDRYDNDALMAQRAHAPLLPSGTYATGLTREGAHR